MSFIINILIYIITGIMLFSYFIKEKYVVSKIDLLADKFTEKTNLSKGDRKSNKVIYAISLMTILILGVLASKVDFTVDNILPLKNYIMLPILIMNFIVYGMIFFDKNMYHLNIIVNLIALVFAKSMFGVDDAYFFRICLLSIIFSLLLMIHDKREINIKFRKIFNSIYLVILVLIIQTYYFGNYVIPTGSMEKTILVGDRIFSNNMIYKFSSPKVGDIISFREPLDNSTLYTKRITGSAGQTFKIDENTEHIFLDGADSNLGRRYSVLGLVQMFGNPEVYIPKKGDKVKILSIVELDMESGKPSLLTTQDFLSKNIDTSVYKYIFGIFNSKTPDQIPSLAKDANLIKYRYSYVMAVEGQENKLVLPILDFKYDSKLMTRLLNGEEITLSDNYYMAMGDNTDNSNDSRFFGYVKESRIAGKLLVRWYPFNRFGKIKDETN